MPEGPNPGPSRRGRRDPQLAAALDVVMEDGDLIEETGEEGPDEEVLLLPGDVIAMKVTHQVTFDGHDSWIAYGVQSRVQDGESEEEAFGRVNLVVNTRVLDAAADAYEKVSEMNAQLNGNRAQRRGR